MQRKGKSYEKSCELCNRGKTAGAADATLSALGTDSLQPGEQGRELGKHGDLLPLTRVRVRPTELRFRLNFA